MATITTSAPVWYNGGSSGASSILGYESGRNRVVRYQFTTPDTGISSLSFTIDGWMHYSGDTANSIKFYIGSSSTDHANAGASSSSTGTATFSPGDGLNGTISGSANIVLQPNTVYYLWLFPGGTNYYCWSNWSNKTATLNNVVGAASTFSLSTTSVNVGSTITVTINANSSSFTHKLKFYINNAYSSEYTVASGTSTYTFTIPTSWYNAMPSTSSCTAYCQMTTHNGSTQIGDASTKSFTVKVADSIKPSIASFALTVPSGRTYLIQGKDTLTLTAKASAGRGSAIKTYVFSGPAFGRTVTTTSGQESVSTATISTVGELTFKVTVTDTRGRSSVAEAKIVCYEYFTPYFNSFEAYRANAGGAPDIQGTYIRFEYSLSYASNVPNNGIVVTCRGANNSAQGTNLSGSILLALTEADAKSRTYTVYLEAIDSYGSTGYSSSITIFGGNTRIFNISSDGTGFAIGKMSESSEMFDVRWDSCFRQNVTVVGNVTANNIWQLVDLWESFEGNAGTITITGNGLDKYTYLEIYFADTNNEQSQNFIKVHQPIGKVVNFSSVQSAPTNPSYTYIRRTRYNITGNANTITIVPDDVARGYVLINNIDNHQDAKVTYNGNENNLKITKIVGYKQGG